MPVTESAKKALRNAEAKSVRNSLVKAELKRALKNATIENLSKVVSLVDKAAKRMVIHPNKAARIKSNLSKLNAEIPSTRAKKATTKNATKRPSTVAKAKTAKTKKK